MATLIQRQLQAQIDRRESLREKRLTEAQKSVRHKCFISFHHSDETEVEAFITAFEDSFIPRVLGVSDEDDFIDSTDTGYVMDQIREKYLTDSTVTIVLVGKCTWARRYVDWEVYSTLRNDKKNQLSGLMAITLPSAADYVGKKLPPRVEDNWLGKTGSDGYARWWKYPSSASSLQANIEGAFTARTSKSDLIVNTRVRKLNNSQCP